MIKIISLFLTVLLLIPVIISCSDSGIAVDDESAITETETAEQMTEKPMPDLPQEDYEGYDFNFLHWTIAGWSYIEGDLAAEQESGETLNDAVYRRNSVIEDRYNIEINAFYESQDKIVNNIKNLVLSEDNTYSAFFPRGFELSTGLFASNSFFDLNTLPYIDFTMPWWDTNLAEGLSVNGRLYAMLSDITIIDKRATGAVLFNKSIAKDYNLPDLYEIINENNWTTEKLLSLGNLR